MDVKFINPILDSIVNVLTVMANLTPSAGKPELKAGTQAPGVVSGLISLEGKKAAASVAISFSKPVILEITRRMLRTDVPEVDDMVQDLVGEIANMMVGGAKSALENKGYDFTLTLPSVIAGEPHEIIHPLAGETIILPFSVEAGEFYVEVCGS